MATYWIYLLNALGHFTGPPMQASCDSDEAAIVLARGLQHPYEVETWQGHRKVALISPAN